MPRNQKNKETLFSYSLLIGSIIGGIGGALLLGHVLHTIALILLGLSKDSFSVLLLPIIVMVIALISGTVILVLAFKIKNNILKIATISFSVIIPSAIEIVDLPIRAFLILQQYSGSL